MKIGLYNLEPKIINTAMIQVSTYHKHCMVIISICKILRADLYYYSEQKDSDNDGLH